MAKSKIVLTDQLSKRLKAEFDEYLIKSQCEHLWKDYGHGFKCDLCQHYTGMNESVNKEIRNEMLTPNQP